MSAALAGRTVLVVGRESGIARAVALATRAEGATVVVAGRDAAKLAASYSDPGVTAETVDLTDGESVTALAAKLGHVARRVHRLRAGTGNGG